MFRNSRGTLIIMYDAPPSISVFTAMSGFFVDQKKSLKDQGPNNTPIVDEEAVPAIVKDLGQHIEYRGWKLAK